jgi:lipopolysaccharide export system protein LptA
MNVHDTEKMVLSFKDAPVSAKPPSGGRIAPLERGATTIPPATGPITVPKPATPPQPEKPARPIDLSAHLVEAHILRLDGNKNELEKLRTEGQVHVHQAPEKPDEKGLEIVGDTLELTKKPDGNEIVVTGDLAELQMDKLMIRGPQVNIDQAENKAWVNGLGAMTIESDRSFQGTPLKHPVPLTIIWNESMLFQGSFAQFTGGIQAEQENAHLACQSLQVTLDRPISLKEGEKNGPPAKVDRLVCDKGVQVDDSEYEGDRLIKYQRIQCRELDVDNLNGTALAYGPKGIVRIFQPGDAGSPLNPPSSAPPTDKKTAQEMKLTVVLFDGRMWADNKSHTAIFNENVQAVNLATENKELELKLDQLPEDALYLRCADQMKVYNRPENGKANQQLEAETRVFCRTKEYEGQAEKFTFNEAKDQLIFDGGDGGLARLKKILGPGIAPQEWKAKRIIYLRKTGQIFSDQVQGVHGATH